MPANIFVRSNQQKTIETSQNISYRNIDRVSAQLNEVGSSYSYAAITVPFAQGLVKRITIFTNGDSDTANIAEVIVSENNTTNKENKITIHKIEETQPALPLDEASITCRGTLKLKAKVQGDYGALTTTLLDIGHFTYI